MPKKQDSSVQVAIIVAGLLAIVGGAWLFLNSSNEEAYSTTQVAAIPSSVPVPEEPTVEALPVDTALQMAEMAFQSGQLTGNEEGTALDFYRQVLEQEPDNRRAKAGMQLIATQLVDEADEMMGKADYEQVVRRINSLNQIEPGSNSVLSLQQQLNEKSAEMFTLMDQAIAAGQPDDAELLVARLRTIPNADAGRINAAMVSIAQTRKDLENAAALAAQVAVEEAVTAEAPVVDVQPEDNAGSALATATDAEASVNPPGTVSEAFELVDPAEQVREQIATLLEDAGAKVEQGRLLEPEGDNAFEIYNQVLALESTNADAKRGLRGMVQKLTSEAYDVAEEGEIDQARDLLEDAESIGIAAPLIAQARTDVREMWLETESQKVYALSGFKVQKSVPPKYPKRAMARSIEGWVKVEFTVAEDGKTRDLKVVESSDRLTKQFTNSALRAVEQWQFEPRVLDGQVVAQRSETTVQFRLTE